MRKTMIFVGMILFLGVSFCFAEEESITITTYYPSPYGSYNELTSRRMKIGTTYSDSAVTVADDNLIVEGNIGIGTVSPTEKLEIQET